MVSAGLHPPICRAHVHVSRVGDYFKGRPLEIVGPSDPLPSAERVEECSQDDDTSAEDLDNWLFRCFNLR